MSGLIAWITGLFMTVAASPLGEKIGSHFNDAAAFAPTGCIAESWTEVYDARFRDAATSYWSPERLHLWCWLKGQAIAESGLNPDAVSPVGAAGISQFMPGTWADIQSRTGWTGSPHDPNLAIQGQAIYMEQLANVWKAKRTEKQRLELATASYNSGLGHVLRSQRLCDNGRTWDEIKGCQIQVTGPDHSAETLGYVRRIRNLWERLTGSPW